MNLVFIGTTKFGLRCLQAVGEAIGIQVVGIVTAPQTFPISYAPDGVTNVLHADVTAFAERNRIPVEQISHGMNDPALYTIVRSWRPDAFLVVGWYHMIPRRWRILAPAYGLHASLLPDYSGGAPLVWAMINGESQTGITLFQMDDGVDSGPIAAQAVEPIHERDTIATLYARIEERGLDLLRQALPALAQGDLRLHPQDESHRRVMRQRSPEDGRIDWATDSRTIDRFIRAQTRPYPGAFSTLHGRPLTIWSSRPNNGFATGEPGCVTKGPDGYRVSCAAGSITIEETTYDQRPYHGIDLAELLGGGQQLGARPRGLTN